MAILEAKSVDSTANVINNVQVETPDQKLIIIIITVVIKFINCTINILKRSI